MTRVRSHEKNNGNIYNNMSYVPNLMKKINQSINKKNNNNEKNINCIKNLMNKKDSESDLFNYLEKNNSFCMM